MGEIDGSRLGDWEGAVEGLAVGDTDGGGVTNEVGETDGSRLGDCEGVVEGLAVGEEVGAFVGDEVISEVGEGDVGDSVMGLADTGGAGNTGEPVDAIVGALVPELLGLPVGETVEGLELATVGDELDGLDVGPVVGD